MKSSQRFVQLANEAMLRQGLAWERAWNATASAYPDLHLLMHCAGQTEQRLEFANAKAAAASPAAQTRHEAATRFREQVHAYLAENHVDYQTAWNRCSRAHVELFNEAMPSTLDAAQAAPSSTGCSPSPESLQTLGLNSATTAEEYAVALRSNRGKLTRFNPGRVCEALIDYWTGKRGGSYEANLNHVKTLHPVLWHQVEEAAKAGV
jgi:hypothetical protein